MSDGHCQIINGECWLYNVHISEWKGCGTYYQHEVKRPRKLLLKKAQILKLEQRMHERNYELIPIRIYLSDKQLIKVMFIFFC